jgi:hypothetical protein
VAAIGFVGIDHLADGIVLAGWSSTTKIMQPSRLGVRARADAWRSSFGFPLTRHKMAGLQYKLSINSGSSNADIQDLTCPLRPLD